MIKPNLLTGADLAFIGDAYYELYIREYILNKGITKLHKLHTESIKYVSSDAQYKIITELMGELTNEEIDIFKRGRNYNYKTKTDAYINASGFEALLGYLYLTRNSKRLNEIVGKAIYIIEGKKHE